jgi:hypothetical protein
MYFSWPCTTMNLQLASPLLSSFPFRFALQSIVSWSSPSNPCYPLFLCTTARAWRPSRRPRELRPSSVSGRSPPSPSPVSCSTWSPWLPLSISCLTRAFRLPEHRRPWSPEPVAAVFHQAPKSDHLFCSPPLVSAPTSFSTPPLPPAVLHDPIEL